MEVGSGAQLLEEPGAELADAGLGPLERSGIEGDGQWHGGSYCVWSVVGRAGAAVTAQLTCRCGRLSPGPRACRRGAGDAATLGLMNSPGAWPATR